MPVSRLILSCVGVAERFQGCVAVRLLALNGHLETRAVLNIKVHQLVGVVKEIKREALRGEGGLTYGGPKQQLSLCRSLTAAQ